MDKYQKYIVLVTYLEPVEGSLLVPATDKGDALLKAQMLFDNRPGLKLIDAFLYDDIVGAPKLQEDVTPGQEVPATTEAPKPTATIIPFPIKKKTDDQ